MSSLKKRRKHVVPPLHQCNVGKCPWKVRCHSGAKMLQRHKDHDHPELAPRDDELRIIDEQGPVNWDALLAESQSAAEFDAALAERDSFLSRVLAPVRN